MKKLNCFYSARKTLVHPKANHAMFSVEYSLWSNSKIYCFW